MDVKAIVKEYLLAHGYGGLLGDDGCGCFVDDLMPCPEPSESCEAAYRVQANCDICDVRDTCPSEGDKPEWCLVTKVPALPGGVEPNTAQQAKVAICENCMKPCGCLVHVTDRPDTHDGYYCPTCIAAFDV